MFRSSFKPGRPEEFAARDGRPMAPGLHAALVRLFGDVRIRKQGELADFQVVMTADGPQSLIRSPGEIYAFDCPHCGDTRKRAWVSYKYGQPDPATGWRMTHLVDCWNEECYREHNRRHEFQMLLLGYGRASLAPPDESRGRRVVRGPAVLPGLVQGLDELPATHPAVRYVASRGFDPAGLARDFGVGYCLDATDDCQPALHRLVIPVRLNGRLVGWQARRLDGKPKFKYFTMPGMQTSQVVYNWDTLPAARVVVLVEGVVDAWSIGPGAGALFGKDLKEGQYQLLQSLVPRQPAVVLLLDRDAREVAERTRTRLLPAFPGRVVVVTPPESCSREDCRSWPVDKVDAGVMTREAVWRLIAGELVTQGVEVT